MSISILTASWTKTNLGQITFFRFLWSIFCFFFRCSSRNWHLLLANSFQYSCENNASLITLETLKLVTTPNKLLSLTLCVDKVHHTLACCKRWLKGLLSGRMANFKTTTSKCPLHSMTAWKSGYENDDGTDDDDDGFNG